MIDETLKEAWAQAATQSFIGKVDGSTFRSFLSQPAIKQALARYVHSEAREMLSLGMSECYGRRGQMGCMEGPDWLDAATQSDWKEGETAYHALEVAIQEEVETRVAAALAEARGQAKKTSLPRLRELTRHLAAAVRRSAGEQQEADRAGAEQALEDAGLKSRPRQKKPVKTV